MKFLGGIFHIHADGSFVVEPFHPNIDFARGHDAFPKVSRLMPYSDSYETPFWILRIFMLGQILRFNAIVQGSWMHGRQALEILIAEALRLQWPQKAISRTLLSIPHKHQSDFLDGARLIGRDLRSSSAALVLKSISVGRFS